MSEVDVVITDNPQAARFEAHLHGEGNEAPLAGVLVYADAEDGTRTLMHTVVGEEYGGHHVGAALASHALGDARSRGIRIVPMCTFVQGYLERHPEQRDVVA